MEFIKYSLGAYPGHNLTCNSYSVNFGVNGKVCNGISKTNIRKFYNIIYGYSYLV